MPEFKNLDDLFKYIQKNPDEVLKNTKEDYINIICPICNKEHKVKNQRNGYGLCEEQNKEFKINLDIKIEP